METLSTVVTWLSNLAYLLIAVWSIREWSHRRDEQSRWLALTFGSLAAVVVIGWFTPDSDGTGAVGLLTRVTLAVIALFPYLLLRFLDSFEPLSRFLRTTALAVGGLLVVLLFAIREFPEEGQSWGLAFGAFAVLFIANWFVGLALVGHRFWRAGRDQPTLARRRLRTLGVGAVVLGSVFLVSPFVGDSDTGQVVTQLLGFSSALMFLLGFAPPAGIRAAWRQAEEQELYTASLRLMGATSQAEVARILLPHLAAVVAARGVVLIQHGEVVGASGVSEQDQERVRGGDATDALTCELSHGAIHVWTDRYTPFFGQEEVALLRRLGLLADLALDRTALLTSEQQARADLERANADLETANAELESFVYSASHDLKSPLIAMLGYLEVIDEEHRDQLSDEAAWYLQRMATNGRYMESLITDLLELSRVGRMQTEPEDVDLDEVVRHLAQDVAARHPHASVVVDQLPHLWLNGTRTRQLFANLIENAAKYAGRDDVTITVDSRPTDDGGIELSVRDDGRGVPEDYREKIFGVFERLEPDDTKSGTGIGLAICRKIVESAGGHIWLADADRGADFRIQLPPEALVDDERREPSAQEVTV